MANYGNIAGALFEYALIPTGINFFKGLEAKQELTEPGSLKGRAYCALLTGIHILSIPLSALGAAVAVVALPIFQLFLIFKEIFETSSIKFDGTGMLKAIEIELLAFGAIIACPLMNVVAACRSLAGAIITPDIYLKAK